MNKLRIVFMGTPGFAVGILDAICRAGYTVAAVVTAPDKPAGRGQKVRYSDVKQYALKNSIPVLQPVNLKDPEFLDSLRAFNANLHVVVAFRMLPAAVWQMPELGTFNLHASLLPQYRGAAPINWALINGEVTTGVSTFFIDDKIDTGAVILRREAKIENDETAETLHDKLMHLGCEAVIDTLKIIEEGRTNPLPQQEIPQLRQAPKLNRENTKIDFTQPVGKIYDLVRGLSPYPSAWAAIIDKGNEFRIKIFAVTPVVQKHNLTIGTLRIENKKMLVAAQDGFIQIDDLQFPGKRRLLAKEFMNGYPLSPEARAN